MLLLLAAAVTFSAAFEGGNIGKVEQTGTAHWRCPVTGQSDQEKRNRQASWYYFRVDGAKGVAVTLDLVNLVGEYNYRPGSHAVTKHTRPVISYDDRVWRHLTGDEVSWDEDRKELRLRFTPERNRVWIAHVQPYTARHLDRLHADLRRHPHVRIEPVGKTVEGRPIPLVTITNPKVDGSRKRTAWLMFRQHAWEAGSSWTGEGALRYLVSIEASQLRDDVVWKIFPMADPDGVAGGGVRFNRNGYDLNRNWDTANAELMPEIAAQKKAIYAWLDAGHSVDFFLSLHNTESGEYLAGPASGIGTRLFRALKETTTFHPSSPLRAERAPVAPSLPGRMSVNQSLRSERQVPAYLMEQRVEFNEKLGRYPTAEDRLAFGAALVRAVAAQLPPVGRK